MADQEKWEENKDEACRIAVVDNHMPRCRWCNLNNPVYVEYHDQEWCVPEYDDRILFELLILEGFQAGLSWECVLNKRQAFREVFDDFNVEKVAGYSQEKLDALAQEKRIIRNRRKIAAAVENAKAFIKIRDEYGTFAEYIWHFTDGQIVYENDRTTSELSDRISEDLKKRGMRFVGSTIVYSYLQAIGVLYSHEEGCFLERDFNKLVEG